MSIAKKSFSIFQCSLFAFAVNLITGAFIARILGPVGMGVWVILMMVPSYAEAIGRFKLDIAAVYYLGQKKYRLGEMCFVLNILALITSAVLLIVLVWQRDFIRTYLFKDVQDSMNLVYLIAVFIPLHFISMNYTYLLTHMEDARSYNILFLILNVLSPILAVFFLIVFKWGVASLVIATLVSVVVGIFYGSWKIQKIEKMVPNFNLTLIKDLFGYGSKLYLTGLVNQLNVYITGLLVALYMMPTQVAFFRMGQDKSKILDKIPDAINTILYPRISKIGVIEKDAGLLTAKCCRFSFLVLSGLAVIGALLIKPLVILLYGEQFIPLTISFWVLLPGVVFMGSTGTLNQYFMGTGRPNILLKIAIVPLAIQILMGVVFIPIYGVLGAAFAASITFMSISIVRLVVFKWITKISYADIVLPKKEDVVLLIDFIKERLGKLFKITSNIYLMRGENAKQ